MVADATLDAEAERADLAMRAAALRLALDPAAGCPSRRNVATPSSAEVAIIAASSAATSGRTKILRSPSRMIG